ncbi:uncharacterized protein LOC116288743 [Actinia tenebrosa]|uniref:Uncharacterized protein LOC116288743 n=1 Tax=Actinia tenebrosa TaxID=6105 RepID=A0A6P8H859_ACTTE|nr:uncharacterized protein LOC116288743 [Actinia tenebrosa]
MAAAQSSMFHKIPVHEDDLSCPVCYDELDDPKSLPVCAHIICKVCLEKMAANSDDQFIECPICKMKSRIPEGGVNVFPTSHLMKRMVETIPGRKEKLELEKALKDCEDKLNDGKATVESIDKLIVEATKKHAKRAQEIKDEVSEHARKLKRVIEEQKNRLLSEVDDTKWSFEILRLKRRKQKLLEGIKQAEVCAKNVQEHLKNNSLKDIQELKQVLVIDLQDHSRKILERNISIEGIEGDDTLKFEKNMKMFAERNLLGSVSKSVRKANVNKVQKAEEGLKNDNFLTINLTFEPLSIAISKSHDRINIGILRSEEKKFDIFTIHGKHVKSIQLDSAPANHLYDAYFSIEDDIILVLDRIDKQLLNYSLDGHCRKSKRLDENVKFISLDENNRIILTTSQNEEAIKPCKVLVFHPDKDELQFRFGERNLENPSGRAVYHKDIFYVPDNYSELKIFDQKGKFIQCVLLNGINPKDYNIFAIDVYEDSIIACDCKKKLVKIFSIVEFSLISTLQIPDAPWMFEALPTTTFEKSRFAVIYDEVLRLDIIGYR